MIFLETVLYKELIFFALRCIRGDLFDFAGFRALCAGEGLVKNGFKIVFLSPYGSPHAYNCQAQKKLGFLFKHPPYCNDEWCSTV